MTTGPSTPAAAPGSQQDERGSGEDTPRTTADPLGDATELAGKSLGSGVATGTGDIAGGIKDQLPITAGALQKTGEVSGEAVSAAAEVVADAIRVLPLEDLGSGDGEGR